MKVKGEAVTGDGKRQHGMQASGWSMHGSYIRQAAA